MNLLLDFAALALSALAVAISVCSLYAVRPSRKKPVSLQQWVVPKDNGALMRDARRLREAQDNGTLIIPASMSPDEKEVRIDLSTDPKETARRINARMGRHL
jgi:hypothetical protein